MKEAKAVFLYDWVTKIDQKIVYERVKEFFLHEFHEVKLCKNSTILRQGEVSSDVFVVKEGAFSLSKTIDLNDPLYNKRGKLPFHPL